MRKLKTPEEIIDQVIAERKAHAFPPTIDYFIKAAQRDALECAKEFVEENRKWTTEEVVEGIEKLMPKP